MQIKEFEKTFIRKEKNIKKENEKVASRKLGKVGNLGNLEKFSYFRVFLFPSFRFCPETRI